MNLTFADSEYPHGVCPFMSGQVVPVGNSPIVRGAAEIAMAPVFVPCLADRCQLWDGSRCSKKIDPGLREVLGNIAVGLTDVGDSLRAFEPPSSGGSPLSRLCEVLEKLVKQRETAPGGR